MIKKSQDWRFRMTTDRRTRRWGPRWRMTKYPPAWQRMHRQPSWSSLGNWSQSAVAPPRAAGNHRHEARWEPGRPPPPRGPARSWTATMKWRCGTPPPWKTRPSSHPVQPFYHTRENNNREPSSGRSDSEPVDSVTLDLKSWAEEADEEEEQTRNTAIGKRWRRWGCWSRERRLPPVSRRRPVVTERERGWQRRLPADWSSQWRFFSPTWRDFTG